MQSPSSTSSSEPKPIRPLREISIVVLVFLIVEVVVRILVGADVLGPPHGQWPRVDFPASIYLIEQQQPDVIAVGNSRVIGGFDPMAFSATIRDEIGQNVSSFNAGHGGTSTDVLGPLTRHFYMPAAPNATIILAISPLDMGGTNAKWNAEAAVFLDTPEVREAMGNPAFNIRAVVDEAWYTFAYRDSLGELIQNIDRPEVKLLTRDALGFYADPTVMDVQATRENFVIEDLAVNENFPQDINGPSLDALIDLMQHSEGRLIVVNAPTYISILPGYEDYESIFLELWPQIETQCAAYDIPCWDLQPLLEDGTLDARHFSNPTHLNAAGAEIFSWELARRYADWLP